MKRRRKAFYIFHQWKELTSVGFADYLPMVAISKHACHRVITLWLRKVSLKAVRITNCGKTKIANIRVYDHQLVSKSTIKYLEVIIDAKINFNSQSNLIRFFMHKTACNKPKAVNRTFNIVLTLYYVFRSGKLIRRRKLDLL